MDIKEMEKDCLEKKREDEEMVYAIGAGRLIPMLGKRKIMKKTLDYIKGMKGFIGVHPIDMWHNLLIFKTLNDAKMARNDLTNKGVSLGQIAPILVGKDNL